MQGCVCELIHGGVRMSLNFSIFCRLRRNRRILAHVASLKSFFQSLQTTALLPEMVSSCITAALFSPIFDHQRISFDLRKS